MAGPVIAGRAAMRVAAAQQGMGAPKRPFYKHPAFIAFMVCLLIGLIVHLVRGSRRDVGGEEMKDSNYHASLRSRDPNDRTKPEDLPVLAAEFRQRVRLDKQRNAETTWSEHKTTISTGGDTSDMVSHYQEMTGVTLSSNPETNVYNASTYFSTIGGDMEYIQTLNGEVVATNMTEDGVKNALEQAALEAEREALEVSELHAAVDSFRSSGFQEGKSGVIQIDGGKFVKFNKNTDDIRLTSDKMEATPVGIVRDKLVMGGDERGVCYPFANSVDSLNRVESVDSLRMKASRLKRHPCIDDITFRHDVVMDGNKISDVGGACFGFGGIRDDELELSRSRCSRTEVDARIVNPDDISSSAENSGLGPEGSPE
jgi:hypothetical protein